MTMARAPHLVRIASRIAANVPAKEGQFAATDGQVVAHLQKFLTAKYAIDAAYRSFGDRVRGPWRDAIVDHWHKHAEEERSQAYDLAMKIMGLGADPAQTSIVVPACEPTLSAFCRTLMEMELKAIENGRRLMALSGSNTSMKVLGENLVLMDTQHLDDLRRSLPTEES